MRGGLNLGKYKKRFGDRYDGRRIRGADPFFKIIAYVMKRRDDSQVFFDERIDIGAIQDYLKEKRSSGIKNISFLHIVIAALVRVVSQKPAVNRFVAGHKLYARNEILLSLAIKKELREDSPETTVKIKFEPTDTLSDVVQKVNKVIEDNKNLDNSNDTDKTAKIISMCPGFIINIIVWLLDKMDSFGIMPRIINAVSPFHTSMFITDLGSLGIQPVYHHIYNFGTTSTFIAFGIKHTEKVLDRNGNVLEKRYVNVRVVGDERICDGHYYANAFKLFRRLMEHPERLDIPPEKVVEDIE
jgi:hypothetical protein